MKTYSICLFLLENDEEIINPFSYSSVFHLIWAIYFSILSFPDFVLARFILPASATFSSVDFSPVLGAELFPLPLPSWTLCMIVSEERKIWADFYREMFSLAVRIEKWRKKLINLYFWFHGEWANRNWTEKNWGNLLITVTDK